MMIFKQLNVNYVPDIANIIPSLSSCAQSISLFFEFSANNLIDFEPHDFTKSITEQLTIKLEVNRTISVMVLKQLLEIFPNVKKFELESNTPINKIYT